jgi:hypothetical protein
MGFWLRNCGDMKGVGLQVSWSASVFSYTNGYGGPTVAFRFFLIFFTACGCGGAFFSAALGLVCFLAFGFGLASTDFFGGSACFASSIGGVAGGGAGGAWVNSGALNSSASVASDAQTFPAINVMEAASRQSFIALFSIPYLKLYFKLYSGWIFFQLYMSYAYKHIISGACWFVAFML